MAAVTPVAEPDRYEALDVLRGFAVLGILLLNIQSFAMPFAAYFNPTALGPPAASELAIWSVNYLLADSKFMTLFSLLFGAGVLLMTTRVAAAGGRPALTHYRRMGWLLVFGLIHAYLLWYGDILVLYAICGLFIYPARRLAPRTLLVLGVAVLSVASLASVAAGLTLDTWPPETVRDMREFWSPDADRLAREVAAFQGGWLAQMPMRTEYAFEFHTFEIWIWGIWRAGGLMLIGMALLRWGVLTGERAHWTAMRPGTRIVFPLYPPHSGPRRAERAKGMLATSQGALREYQGAEPLGWFYTRLAAAALAIGLPLIAWGIVRNNERGWPLDAMLLGAQWNYWGSVLVSLGWMSLLLRAWQAGAARGLMHRLGAVGRMAFSSYILQTLLCTSIFYGHGLGLFGRVDRVGQMMVVCGVWIVLLAVAPAWLQHFRYGPLEWMWRTLTYGRVEPLARGPRAATAPVV